jgi:hypothetical protein
MLYVKPVCRIIGWLFTCVGTIGLFASHLGEYIHFSTFESWTSLTIGLCFVYFARRRERLALLAALCIGIILITWSIAAFFVPEIQGTAEPIEFLLRIMAGLWAIYAAIQDILVWRSTEIPS